MKSEQNSNSGTFPSGDHRGVQPEYGLSKREYFAGLAMQGLLANYVQNGQYGSHTDYPQVSIIAVRVADELLKQLSE